MTWRRPERGLEDGGRAALVSVWSGLCPLRSETHQEVGLGAIQSEDPRGH